MGGLCTFAATIDPHDTHPRQEEQLGDRVFHCAVVVGTLSSVPVVWADTWGGTSNLPLQGLYTQAMQGYLYMKSSRSRSEWGPQ